MSEKSKAQAKKCVINFSNFCPVLECLTLVECLPLEISRLGFSHEYIGTHCPGCIPCKAHAACTLVAPQVHTNVEGWRTPEVQRSKEPCADICNPFRGGARGGLGGYSPPSKHASPRRKVKRDFVGDFWHL